eukprot:TRINITY_DN7643_c0_g1_i4.p1 TRINITY_DN7643_c0_g1~~TRINITY_DN7643_c0_g1_i4.p1  ORF type:complete len:223 (+),score=13.24 TRINITY_DN7643_c0_g1_i4:77-670(+)
MEDNDESPTCTLSPFFSSQPTTVFGRAALLKAWKTMTKVLSQRAGCSPLLANLERFPERLNTWIWTCTRVQLHCGEAPGKAACTRVQLHCAEAPGKAASKRSGPLRSQGAPDAARASGFKGKGRDVQGDNLASLALSWPAEPESLGRPTLQMSQPIMKKSKAVIVSFSDRRSSQLAGAHSTVSAIVRMSHLWHQARS